MSAPLSFVETDQAVMQDGLDAEGWFVSHRGKNFGVWWGEHIGGLGELLDEPLEMLGLASLLCVSRSIVTGRHPQRS